MAPSTADLVPLSSVNCCISSCCTRDGYRGQAVENSTGKDVSQESRDRISATAKWCSLTDGHLLVSSCLRTGREKTPVALMATVPVVNKQKKPGVEPNFKKQLS